MILENLSPKVTDLICPITGNRIISEPVEKEVRDPSHFYFAEGRPNIRFERHPFSWNIFRQVYGGERTIGSKVLSWWKLEDDKSWTQMKQVNGIDKLVPFDTSEEDIKKLIKEVEKEKKRNYENFVKRLANGDPILPIVKKISAKTISEDLVEIKPMNNSSINMKNLFDIEYVYNTVEIVYPYLVTNETLNNLRIIWGLEKYKMFGTYGDLQSGDTIDEWKHGGPLSMRWGESIIRDGVEIYSRLTAMS